MKTNTLVVLALGCALVTGVSAQAKTKLAFWTPETDPAQHAATQAETAAFNQSQGKIEVAEEDMDGEALKLKIRVAMAANEMPDVFHYWSGDVFKGYVDGNAVADLTPYIEKDPAFQATLVPGALDSAKYNGKIYGIPKETSHVVFWYNKEIFAKYNLAVPKTWKQLIAAVDVLNKNKVIPIAAAGKDRWPLLFYFAYLSQRFGGQEPFKAAADGRADFTQENFVKAADAIKELVDHKAFQPGFMGMTYGQDAALFTSGKAAMNLMGDWTLGSFASDKTIGTTGKLGWFPFPTVDGGKGLLTEFNGGFGSGYAVSAKADVAAGFQFIKFLLAPENRKGYVQSVGTPSPVKLKLDASKMNPAVASYISEISSFETGFFPFYDQGIDSKRAEKVLNTVTKLMLGVKVDSKTELATIK